MSAHNPGPWRYLPHSVDANYMRIYCSSDPSEGDNLRGYCGEANARLIAAAPDLLDALQNILRWAVGTHEINEREEGRTVDYESFPEARAAIRKATGEAA